jgi:endonuclease/exonuclease/phosphatase family metal-dependent hydrolase
MPQEIRFATFNLYNLAPAGAKLYDNLAPATAAQYEAKVAWTARQIDQLGADVIGFQEVFSQSCLRDALARTRHYRDATHVGFDPDPVAERLTPSVALVSRLPLAGPGVCYPLLPPGVAMPAGSRDPERFSRPVLHARLMLPGGSTADVLVVHLKSKRPDFRNGDSADDPLLYAMANVRSLVRRATEAAGLRVLLCNLALGGRRARVVLGDFNDVANAVTTDIVLGAGNGPGPVREPAAGISDRLYDCYQIQLRQDHLRHVGFSNIQDGHFMTIDHILVSEEFNPSSRHAIGEVLDVCYLNDHLTQDLPEASDHGQVVARINLYDRLE